jgi:hypothetical protein
VRWRLERLQQIVAALDAVAARVTNEHWKNPGASTFTARALA